ncbi:hypothetical protein HZH68_006203 [Vespula germanica]|uniref:Uncharacterized protein n=1 Tax=Vespula germanica TaxID=30212 RepID=A0A834KEM7_VESGE|nr:hypothetical protein HZH68_006203 [Vespula germanica]
MYEEDAGWLAGWMVGWLITSIFFDEDERVPSDFCFQRVPERILKGSRRRREIGEKSLRGGKVGPQELRAGRNDERFHKVSNGLGGYSSKSARVMLAL